MADISFLLHETINWQTGLWGTLIGWFNGFILNYGWTIIVFTLIFINMGLGAKGLALSFTLSYVVHTALQLLYLRHISR